MEILRSLDHPNIIKLYEAYRDPSKFYLVTELCTGGELFDMIQDHSNFDERAAC